MQQQAMGAAQGRRLLVTVAVKPWLLEISGTDLRIFVSVRVPFALRKIRRGLWPLACRCRLW